MDNDGEVVEYLERLIKKPLCEGNRGPLSGISIHVLHTYLKKGAPRAVARDPLGWDDAVWGLIDSAAEGTAFKGTKLLESHGLAPRPDWLKKVKRAPFTRLSEAGGLDDIDLVEQAERLGLRTEVTRNQSTDDLQSSDSLTDIEHRLFG